MPHDLVTFDCFDTVLTRVTGSPRATTQVVAHAVRRLGLLDHDVAVVASARRRAEDLCWHEVGETATLTDVWALAADLLHVDAQVVPDLVRAELDVERRVLVAVPGAAGRVARARATGARVGFLSDTLLGSDVLRERLRDAGVWADGDEVWVSNELGATKDRGGAFPAVARDLGGTPDRWVHHGDSDRSDVTMARRHGVRGELLPAGRLGRYETLLDGTAAGTAGLAGLLAGSARVSRLGAGEVDATTARVVTGLAAPVLLGFALWALRLAERDGRQEVRAEGTAAPLLDGVLRRLVDALDLPLRVAPPAEPDGPAGTRVVAPGPAAAGTVLWLGDPDPAVEGGRARTYLPHQQAGVRGRVPADALVAVLSTLAGPDAPGAPLVAASTEHLVSHLDLVDPWLDVREGLLEALAAFWLRPSRSEADLLAPACGDWPGAALVTGPAPVRLARRGAVRVRRGWARAGRAGRQLAARRGVRGRTLSVA